ncbi:MAG: chemotaxis protein CheA [Verrucomicrobiota bacterium]
MNEDIQKRLIGEFIQESLEAIESFDHALLELESGENTGDDEILNTIFRNIHTIKGTSGCLGLSKIESVAHVGESLLSKVRDGEIKIEQGLITLLLSFSDALNAMLKSLQDSGNEGVQDYHELVRKLHERQEQSELAESPKIEQKEIEVTSSKACFGLFEEEDQEHGNEIESKQCFGLFADEDESEEENNSKLTSPADPDADRAKNSGRFPAPNSQTKGQDFKQPEVKQSEAQDQREGLVTVKEKAIRVDVNQLDKLMNLVGELVLARNQIVQYAGNMEDNALLAASQRLNLITTELQEGVMKTRMQPIGNVWAKFPRVVRDVCLELGKKVKLDMVGKETDLDRTLIEAIKDPLTHIVRNAIDHGIEMPEERVKAGKTEEGILLLRAYHEGGQVNIEIVDDGGGINVERVKAKAIEKGLISSEEASRMGERDVYGLIFSPGFSTAPKVTNLSGRGVGMDVVKTNIEKIGGSIDIKSEIGQGTILKLKIPLTLAIIPALIVTVGDERFAIPQVNLLELVYLEGEEMEKSIEYIDGTPICRLRGKLLPLVFLSKELQVEGSDGEKPKDDQQISIVVLQADDKSFGLVVDQINDTEEIVVKPLSKQLKNLSFFAGATIMGDGKVALILDVMGLAQHSHVISEVRSQSSYDERDEDQDTGSDKETLLLFGAGSNQSLAIPLSLVDRLEEFDERDIEYSGRQEVIQYRGQILPLIRVENFIDGTNATTQETKNNDSMQVVVYSEQNRSVGLVVGQIKDIVEESLTVKKESSAHGLTGSAVIQESVTDFLDVKGIIQEADPSFFENL